MATTHDLTLQRVGAFSRSVEPCRGCSRKASGSYAAKAFTGFGAGHLHQQRRMSNSRALTHSVTAQPFNICPTPQAIAHAKGGCEIRPSSLHSLHGGSPLKSGCSKQIGRRLCDGRAEERWAAKACHPCSDRWHRVVTRAAKNQWTQEQSPYETLGVQGDAVEEDIKTAYRNLVKIYHPDVYTGSEDGEPEGARFIRIQAAYELLMDREARLNYDRDHKRNPFKASEAWQAYVARKKKAFEQRGDVAASAWAEVQRHEMQVKARQMAKQKMDPEEERRLLAKELQLKAELFDKTSKRHMLVLKKRDLAKQRAGEDAKKLLVQKLLLEEGFELEDED